MNIDKLLERITNILALLGAVLLALLTLASAFDALWRIYGGRSLPGVIDYGESMLVAITFLGLATALRYDEHISVDVVVTRLSKRLASKLESIAWCGVIIILFFCTWVTLLEAIKSFESGEERFGLISMPLWPGRAVIPLSLLVLTLESFRRVICILSTGKKTKN